MKLKVFQVPQTTMNELRILAARAGPKMLLLYQPDAQPRLAFCRTERKVAKDTRPVNAPAYNQNIELGFSQPLELLTTRDGHLSPV